MQKTQEEYENLINTSPVFELDPRKDSTLFRAERSKLFAFIAEYYKLYIYRNKAQDEYGFVLIQTADECLRYYKKSNGAFVNLLNYAMKRKYAISIAKERREQIRKGIQIGVLAERQIRIIVKYASVRGWDLSDAAARRKIAEAMNLSAEEVNRLLAVNRQATAVSDSVVDEDGEVSPLFALLSSDEPTAEELMVQREKISEILENIEKIYLSLPEKTTTKHLVSMVITAKIIREFSDDIETVLPAMRSKSFYSEEVALYFIKQGATLSMKQIAEQLGLSLPDASQRMKRFYAKFKNNR